MAFLCCIHESKVKKISFFVFLALGLVLFNIIIAAILAFFWINAFPSTQPKMFFGLILITLGLAMAMRFFRPIHCRHLSNHGHVLAIYTMILLGAGLFGGLAFGWPAFNRHYVIPSDRWADIVTTIIIVEITSLYSLLLSLIVAIGSSNKLTIRIGKKVG